MHRLEQLIAEWRETMSTMPGAGSETIDELENHLRETTEQFIKLGMSEVEAFQHAVNQLGSTSTITSEFKKLNPPIWLPVKVVIGAGFTVAAALVVLVSTRFTDRGSSLLLAGHVFAVTLGYVLTFLIGALGICFVCQRCFSDFSPSRLQSIRAGSFILSCLATSLTAAGLILGMLWTKAEWRRFWAWDPKETAGLCVLVWLLLFLAGHRLRRMTTRGLLLLSIVGNIIVGLAWFGPVLGTGLHSHGNSNYWIVLAIMVALNLSFLLLGLTPTGCLRSDKSGA